MTRQASSSSVAMSRARTIERIPSAQRPPWHTPGTTIMLSPVPALPSTMKCSLTAVGYRLLNISPTKLILKPTGPEYRSKPPNLETVEVNLHGASYTTKLALHSFIRQNGTNGPSSSQTDTSLTLVGSGAAFIDCPCGVQYQSTKWGARGIMHALRRTTYYHGSRVNMILPW
jgi:hypothetical protein